MNDGGSAFPRPVKARTAFRKNPDWIIETVCGMSLRDWFAGTALIGLLSNAALQDCREPDALSLGPAWFADQAGVQADAMIAERENCLTNDGG